MGQLASQLFHGQVCVIPSLSQLQWADKRSRVHFKCAICIWNLLLSTVKMRSKELSLSVKQAIIRLKKQNKPIREIAKTLGVAKTTVWNILKKKERTGELSNTKRPGRPRKTTVVDERRILSLVKKTPFTTVGQIKNTLQEVGVCVSKSTIKRRLHQSEYRGFTTRCKPLVSLKNRKARLEFAKRHLKSLHSSGTTSYGQMRPRSTCTRVMGREEYGEGKELLMILSIPPHQWSMMVVVSWRGHVWLPVELILLYLLMMWLLTNSRMNSEVFRAILSAHIQPNASELIGRRFTVQMDNDPKHTAKATKEFLKGKKWTVMQWPSQSPDLNPIEHAFHLLKTKLKGKCPKNKQELKTVAVEAWQSITRDETQRLVMSMRSRLQAVIDCKGFATNY